MAGSTDLSLGAGVEMIRIAGYLMMELLGLNLCKVSTCSRLAKIRLLYDVDISAVDSILSQIKDMKNKDVE